MVKRTPAVFVTHGTPSCQTVGNKNQRELGENTELEMWKRSEHDTEKGSTVRGTFYSACDGGSGAICTFIDETEHMVEITSCTFPPILFSSAVNY